LGAPFIARSHRDEWAFAKRTAVILLALTFAIAFLLTPVSLSIWHYAPKLAFLQFPWRILAILAVVFGLSVALAIRHLRLKPLPLASIALAIAALLIVPAYHFFQQPCDPADTVEARLALFHSPTGTDPTDEYTPANADNDTLKHADPPYWLVPPQAPDLQPEQTHPGQAPRHLELKLPAPEILVLNLRDFPAWRITRNGMPVAKRIQREDDLIALPLPAGTSAIDIAESRPWDRTAGDAISVVALLAAAVFLRSRKIEAHGFSG
jgi:hypothetical protein